MKKFLVITHSAEITGGAEIEFQRLLYMFSSDYKNIIIECLIPSGPSVKLINNYVSRIGIYKYGFLPVIYKKFSDYLRYLYISYNQISDIRKFTKGVKYDLCIINVAVLIIPALYLKLKGCKNVFLIKEKVEPKFIRYLLYKTISYCSVFVFFNSFKIKNEFIRFTSDKNVMHLYTSVYSDKPNKVDASLSKKIKIDKSKFNILCVGDITERKNQSLLLEALGSLRDINACFQIHFVGEYDLENEYYVLCNKIIEKTKISTYINFYGRLEHNDLSLLFDVVDLVVICSISEGIPYVLFDALKYGKILISTDVGGISEILINNYNGFLVGLDSKELAYKIEWVLHNRKGLNRISVNAKKTFRNYLNSDSQMKIMINKLIELSN